MVAAVVLILIFSNVFVPTASAWGSDIIIGSNVNTTTCTGDILISPDGTTWGNTFNSADLACVPGNSLPPILNPVSFNPASKSFAEVTLLDGAFTSIPAPMQSYVKYTFYAKLPYETEVSTDVSLAPFFASTAAFAYAAIDTGTVITVLNGSGCRSYIPVNSGCFGMDINSNDIIDPADVPSGYFGPLVTATIAASIPLTFTQPGEIKAITVYMWAEGQDPACSGPKPLSVMDISMSLDAPVINYGDINGDETVSVIDAFMALHASTGMLVLSEAQFILADVNKSNSVTAVDALKILQYSTGMIANF